MQHKSVTEPKNIEAWLNSHCEAYPNLDRILLEKACKLAQRHEHEKETPFISSALQHGLAIADTLLELQCDSHTIAAAIIYPSAHYLNVSRSDISENINQKVYKMVSSVRRMDEIYDDSFNADSDASQAEVADNIRKMLLAIVDDVRIVLIKLAERLVALHHLKHEERDLQIAIANQTMHIYGPLANRLGIGQIKWQMEDLSFRYLNPDEYKGISKELKMRRTEREQFIHDMQAQLEKLLADSYVEDASISGRAKHIFSIHRKMTRKRVDFQEIYDASAFRILVNSIKDCYTVLGIIHATWPHISKEFDDYIAKPKPNGYQSIHTVVIGPNNINVEVQIRTKKMHEEAELGVAAHWKYKEGASSDTNTYEEKISLLREVMDWQKEISADEEIEQTDYNDIFKDRIYVFSPNGDVFDLSAGATPLDFAYHVHTEVGHRCRGAKVNSKLVPLTHQLQTGDRVQIITAKEGHPSRDWLDANQGYLVTHNAVQKVKHWFRKQQYQEHLDAGQAIWEKAYRREGIPKSKLLPIIKKLNFKNIDDLLAAIGAGDIGIQTVINQIRATEAPASETDTIDSIPVSKEFKPKAMPDHSGFIIEGVGNLLTQLARCCKPIPGDEIIGYITKGRGISIHQRSCKNVERPLQENSHRLIEVDWGAQKPTSFPVDIIIRGHDRPGLLRDISNIIANEDLSVQGLTSNLNRQENIANINLTIEIKSLEPLNKLLTAIRQVPGVVDVIRK